MIGEPRDPSARSPALFGREAELAALDAAVEAVRDGPSVAVSIVGGPGIGKSRLLAEFAARAGAAGHLVLAGTASELERDLPFGVFVDALDEYVEAVDGRRLSRLQDDVATELARMLPSFAGAAGAAEALQHERYRSHRAVQTLLETLATRPLVLLLDDFHWADPASVELAGALLRRLPASRVVIVFSSRPRPAQDRFGGELSRAHRAGTLTQLDLATLSFEDARRLLGDAVGEDRARVLYESTGGNPFYLEQLARAQEAWRPANGDAAVAPEGVPPMVMAAIAEELAGLPDAERRLLQAAAVAGDPFEPELAAAAAGAHERDTIEALDELLRRDFIRATDVPRRFRLRHPLVRLAVYESASPAWRLTAHERCAAALAARGAAPSARAHHVERCARQGDAEAIALLIEAGTQSVGRAPGTAERWFAGALRLLSDDAPAEQRIELLVVRGRALAGLGRRREAHALLEQALELVPERDGELRVRVVTECAEVERFLGHYKRAHARVLEASADAAPGGEQAIALALQVAFGGLFATESTDMRAWAGRAARDADALGHRRLSAAAYAMLALAGAWTGQVAPALEALAIATRLVDDLTDRELADRIEAGANLAAAELYLDRFPDAARHAERTLAVARSSGQGHMLPAVHAVTAAAWTVAGRLREAGDVLDGAIEASRIIHDEQGLAWGLLNRSSCALHCDINLAHDTAREAVQIARGLDRGLISVSAAIRLGIVQIELGDSARGAGLIVETAGGEDVSRVPGGWRALVLESLVDARVALGDLAAARATGERARAWAAEVGLPLGVASSDRIQAKLALAEGRPHDAAPLALAAVDGFDALGARLDAGLARIEASRALAAVGERDQALALLRTSADEFAACGALRRRDACDLELRRLGERVQRRGRGANPDGDGFESLTDREREIALLVAGRLTNREIATRLFLSEKTIESHMRNVFRKLGVSSRVHVARAVERMQDGAP